MNYLQQWNIPRVWQQHKQIEITFMKKLGADCSQEMLAFIWCNMFCRTVWYKKYQVLPFGDGIICFKF